MFIIIFDSASYKIHDEHFMWEGLAHYRIFCFHFQFY